MIFSLFAISFFICLNSYGQNRYEEKIKWKSKEEIGQIFYIDTVQIKEEYIEDGLDAFYYTKSMIINNTSLFFSFFPVGSGECIWSIEIYKQEYNQWRLVAEGEVLRPVHSITAEINESNNSIKFYSLIFEFDSNTHIIKSTRKGEEIDEISISDLLGACCVNQN